MRLTIFVIQIMLDLKSSMLQMEYSLSKAKRGPKEFLKNVILEELYVLKKIGSCGVFHVNAIFCLFEVGVRFKLFCGLLI